MTSQMTPEEIAELFKIADGLCMAAHPHWSINCIKNRDHDGEHWFQARWPKSVEETREIPSVKSNRGRR